MKNIKKYSIPILTALLLSAGAMPAGAAVYFQCPTGPGGSFADLNGDGIIRADDGEINMPVSPNEVCMHLGSGDGYVVMADGRPQYMFSYMNLTNVPDIQAMDAGMLAATFPAPKIILKQGDEFYLSLTNVGMMIRPDLFDTHTIHWHGFPEAAPVFDGVPHSSIAVIMGATLTYYYNVAEPGTYMYHCHVEATEHMQMGMIGNLYVTPFQNGTPYTYQGKTYTQFAYNDGDGSTGYDVEYAIQMGSFDPDFHDASETVQPLPFSLMKDKYAMLNGRGYPDTINPNPLPAPVENGGIVSQPESSLITATQGDRILLRLSDVNITRYYTLACLGIPMEVVGQDAKHLRGPDGKNLYYKTSSLTIGGGQAYDVILDTTDVAPGTYFLYTTNLNYLSNLDEDFGGMMTEIIIN